jgi:hypothetical protein
MSSSEPFRATLKAGRIVQRTHTSGDRVVIA